MSTLLERERDSHEFIIDAGQQLFEILQKRASEL